jgi:hypothetical protein
VSAAAVASVATFTIASFIVAILARTPFRCVTRDPFIILILGCPALIAGWGAGTVVAQAW